MLRMVACILGQKLQALEVYRRIAQPCATFIAQDPGVAQHWWGHCARGNLPRKLWQTEQQSVLCTATFNLLPMVHLDTASLHCRMRAGSL